MEPQRRKALDATLLQIEKQFGRGAIMRSGETLEGATRFTRGAGRHGSFESEE